MKKQVFLTAAILVILLAFTTEKGLDRNGNLVPRSNYGAAAIPAGKDSRSVPAEYSPTKKGILPTGLETVQDHSLSGNGKNHKNGDPIVYVAGLLMGLATWIFLRGKRKTLMNLTRWAKANPGKTQGVMAAMQLPLMALAFYSGHNLKELGYEPSGTLAYVFVPVMALGYLAVPFLPKRQPVILPQQVARRRAGYLGIILSSLLMLAFAGNNFVSKHPRSPVSFVIKTIDRALFKSTPDHKHQENVASEKAGCKCKTKRQLAGAGMCVLAILLTILLVGTTCAGICIAILSVAEAASVATAILGLLGGLALSILSVFGIVKVLKWCSKKASSKPKT